MPWRLLFSCVFWLVAGMAVAKEPAFDQAPHDYWQRALGDRFTHLKEAVDAGRVVLDGSGEKAFLLSLLRALEVPASSQMLVFSTTSLQLRLITPDAQLPYDPATASFRSLRPDHPLGTPGGWGAWEIKARYSDIDLDYLPFNSAATGGVAGGKQDVWSVGLNWYPTNGLRFALDYDNIQINHVNAPATDISASAIALRSQIQF